jgi:Cu/Ag efflux protein CusF
MKKVFASLTAIAMLGVLVVAPGAMAQDKTIEGQVMSVDPTGKSVTLQDGTKLSIPETVKFTQADLKPGAKVKAAYQEKDGQKVLTNLEIAK